MKLFDLPFFSFLINFSSNPSAVLSWHLPDPFEFEFVIFYIFARYVALNIGYHGISEYYVEATGFL